MTVPAIVHRYMHASARRDADLLIRVNTSFRQARIFIATRRETVEIEL